MVGIKSDVGIVRSLNEDYAGYIEEEEFKLYVVADGMGCLLYTSDAADE